MSEQEVRPAEPDAEFVVSAPADRAAHGVERGRQVANPDDPPVPAALQRRRGRLPVSEAALPGRMAIVQGQVYVVAVILVVQLWLVTVALFELLSGRPQSLWGLAGASGVGFLLALVVALWPRRRARGW